MNPQYVIKDDLGRIIGPFTDSQVGLDWALQRGGMSQLLVLCSPEDVV